MPIYHAPLKDMQFVLNEVWDLPHHLSSLSTFSEITPDVIDAVLAEAAKFNENILFPLNRIGDQQGCQFNHGEVTTPAGFKAAYQQFCEGGWTALTADPEFGGQGLPQMVGILIEEMLAQSNVSFSLYIGLTQGVYRAIKAHATEDLKQRYLPHMVSGRFSGAMCLTESHCGTDLSLVRTKAEPQADNTFLISGTKIFITSGEHDLSDNIIHLVLARTPNAPAGIKGLSLFLAPKYLINDDGSIRKHNGIHCGSIEHKMGIKGSATCVMNYDNAVGYLVGPLHQGMACMFTVMNIERLSIGIQGLGLSEVSYQNALQYAKDRLQGRAAAGPVFPEKNADPLMVHPDVRRMLLTMKAYNEAARALSVWVAKQVDISEHHSDSQTRKHASALVELFTPIIKAFFTDYGFESCNLGLQVFGGHGYICEWGMEQYVRDARIAQIYEGTNGVQALDLVRRKLCANKGEYLNYFIAIVDQFCKQHAKHTQYIAPLQAAMRELQEISQWLLQHVNNDPNELGAAAVEYLHLFSLTVFAYMWAKMAVTASAKSGAFYTAKLKTADFYMQRLLPKIDSLVRIIKAGSAPIMNLETENF